MQKAPAGVRGLHAFLSSAGLQQVRPARAPRRPPWAVPGTRAAAASDTSGSAAGPFAALAAHRERGARSSSRPADSPGRRRRLRPTVAARNGCGPCATAAVRTQNRRLGARTGAAGGWRRTEDESRGARTPTEPTAQARPLAGTARGETARARRQGRGRGEKRAALRSPPVGSSELCRLFALLGCR